MISAFTTELKYIRNVSSKTLELYGWSFKAFDGSLDNRAAVIARVGELRDKGVKPVSINTYLRCVNAYFNWLHKEHGKELVKIPKLKEESTVLQTLSADAVRSILNGKPGPFHTLCCLLLDTGLRIDEALSLPKEEVDFDQLTIKVRGKGGKHRLIPLSQELRKIIWRYSRTHTGALLFTTKNNTKVSQRNILRSFKQLGKQIGRPDIHPHMLRHTFACNWIRKGGDLFMLSRVLGHSDIKTTAKYLRGLGVADIAATSQRVSLLAR